MLVGDLLDAIDRRAPFASAADWDAVGLQLGAGRRRIFRAAFVHEMTSALAERMCEWRYDAAVSYHPALFRPLTAVRERPGPEGRVMALLERGVSLISVHTAWDVASGGCADALADALGVETDGEFASLEPDGGSGSLGRVGVFRGNLSRLPSLVEEKLGSPVRAAGLRERLGEDVSEARVAVLPGSGGSFAEEAAACGADVFVTGDVSHHQARLALDLGMAVIDAGHLPTERPGVRRLYDFLAETVGDEAQLQDWSGPDDHPWEAL